MWCAQSRTGLGVATYPDRSACVVCAPGDRDARPRARRAKFRNRFAHQALRDGGENLSTRIAIRLWKCA